MALRDPNFAGITEPVVRAFREMRTGTQVKLDKLTQAVAFRGALVKRTTNQSIPSSTNTTVVWETVVYDTSGFWSSSNPSRLTIPAGVKRVRVMTNIEWAASFPEGVVVLMRKNSLDFSGMGMMRGTGNGGGGINIISAPISVVQGDYFTVLVYQGSASAQSIYSANTTWFAIEVIE